MSLSELEHRLQELELQVAKLKIQVNLDQSRKQEVELPTTPILSTRVLSTEHLPKNIPKQGNWLGYIAILCFVLAAGFILKLSIETGWLTPERQLGLCFVLGVGLIASGLIVLPLDKAYASLLPAGGIIILYITAFAAYRVYFLITFQTGIVLTSLISAVSIWLYLKIRHDLYAIAASLGTYLAPVVLNLDANAEFSLYYFLICSCTYATLSIWVQSRTLTVISAYLAILISGLVGLHLQQDGLIAIILAFHFLVFATGTYFYSQQMREPLTEGEAWGLFPVLMIFYAMEYFYIDRAFPGLAAWVSIGFAALLIGLYLSAKKWFPDRMISSQSLIVAFATLVFFHSIYLELLPNELRPWLFVAIILALAYIPSKYIAVRSESAFFAPSLAIFAILVIEYASMIVHLLEFNNYSWVIVSLASFVSIWILLSVKNTQVRAREEQNFALLVAAHILGITAIYQLVSGSLAVSACWLLYAVVVISYAYIYKDKVMAKSALLILSVAAGKALLYDAASAPTLVRIICLLLTGVVLSGCGFVMKKIETWNDG